MQSRAFAEIEAIVLTAYLPVISPSPISDSQSASIGIKISVLMKINCVSNKIFGWA